MTMKDIILLFELYGLCMSQSYAPIVQELSEYVASNLTFAMQLNITFMESGYGPNSSSPMTYDEMYDFFNSWLTISPLNINCSCVCISGPMLPFISSIMGNNILKYSSTIEWFAEYMRDWNIFLDSPNSTYSIESWYKCPSINMTEYIVPTNGYTSFNQFFTRKIKPEYRPIASPNNDSIFVSPCDGSIILMEINNIQRHYKYNLKNELYNISEMLGYSEYSNLFINGSSIQLGLSTTMLHRYYSPISGQIISIQQIGGWYFADNNGSNHGYSLSWTMNNRRGIVFIQSNNNNIGLIAYVAIGIDEASSVNFDVIPGQYVDKGDEIGYFAFGGSTMVVLLQPNVLNAWDVADNQLVLMGQHIAKLNT